MPSGNYFTSEHTLVLFPSWCIPIWFASSVLQCWACLSYYISSGLQHPSPLHMNIHTMFNEHLYGSRAVEKIRLNFTFNYLSRPQSSLPWPTVRFVILSFSDTTEFLLAFSLGQLTNVLKRWWDVHVIQLALSRSLIWEWTLWMD